MKHRVTCPNCVSLVEYDDRSVWEGNKEHEEFICPVCQAVIGTAFTDQIPHVTLICKGHAEEE